MHHTQLPDTIHSDKVCSAHPLAGSSSVAPVLDADLSLLDSFDCSSITNDSYGELRFQSCDFTSHYLSNQQFSINAVTSSTGSIAERYAFTAYGELTILDGSGSVISNSSINNRYTYTGREWDATVGLYHFRARCMRPTPGRFVGSDLIGYFNGLILYSMNFGLETVDPLGLWQQPPFSEPGYTNCAGYALGNGTSIQPGDGSVIDMTDGMGYQCAGTIGALGCKGHCKDKACAVGYIYIRNGMSPADEQRIRQLLEWMVQNSTDPRVVSIEELVLYEWNEVIRWLNQMGIRYPDGGPPIDFHFSLNARLPAKFFQANTIINLAELSLVRPRIADHGRSGLHQLSEILSTFLLVDSYQRCVAAR